jgi:ABC-type multidrug transport system ATPase subunit
MPTALLRAIEVCKRYGDTQVLNRVTVSVHAGEAVAIVGENGAGKSTLLRICAGLISPDQGAVRLSGRVGYCPQEPGLFDLLTADEHLALFGPGLGLARAESLRNGRQLLDELGFPVGDRSQVRHLSGGARQKLNLALALLGGARVLLLDEPYQGFDRGAYVSFWEHVAGWKQEGVAVVVVTHLLTDTLFVDRVVELKIGGSGARTSNATPCAESAAGVDLDADDQRIPAPAMVATPVATAVGARSAGDAT